MYLALFGRFVVRFGSICIFRNGLNFAVAIREDDGWRDRMWLGCLSTMSIKRLLPCLR